MKNLHKIIILAFLFNTISISCVDSVNPPDIIPIEKPVLKPGVKNSGIFAIWYGSKSTVFSLPMVEILR